MSTSAIKVGASRGAIREARESVVAILNAGREERTTRAALKALGQIASVNNTNISGGTFTITTPERLTAGVEAE